MKNNFPLIFFLGFIISCSQRSNNIIALDPVRNEIKNNLDSTEYFLDQALNDVKRGISSERICEKYAEQLNILRRNADGLLLRSNKIASENFIDSMQYDIWVHTLPVTRVSEKARTLKSLGVDFFSVPETHIYTLDNKFIDPTFKTEINLTYDWRPVQQREFTFCAVNGVNGESQERVIFGYKVNPAPNTIYTEEFYGKNVHSIVKGYPAIKTFEEKNIIIDGVPAKYITFYVKRSGLDLYSMQIYFIKNGRGYIIQAGTESKETFFKDKKLFIEMARSFRVPNA